MVSIDAVGGKAPAEQVLALTDALRALGDLVAEADGHYRVEMLMPGSQPADAVKAAMWVWRSALADAGLPDWPVVRVDVQPLVPVAPTARKSRRPA